MLTVNKLIPGGRGLAPVLLRRAARVELDWDVRQRSRFEATDSNGRALAVFLPRGSVVRGGDVLVAEDGSMVVVDAAAEPVMVVTPCPHHGSAFDLTRAAYHLGNRHVALELRPDRLQLEPDPVLADLLRHMDLIVGQARAPFEPESGAYASAAQGTHGGHGHGHGHGHVEAPRHEHEHGHGHGHEHEPAQEHGHEHEQVDVPRHEPGPAHGHGHDRRREPEPGAAEAAAGGRGLELAPAQRSEPEHRPAAAAAATPHVHGPGCGHSHA